MKTAILDQLTHPYFSTALYHPHGVALWFQTINIFNGLTFLPVQVAGNLFWAYNAVVLFSFVVAGYGAMLLALLALARAGAKPGPALWAGALLAGGIYTFAPFHFAHLLGHMQVFSLQFIPFYVLYLLRATPPANTFRRHDTLMAALFLILAALCDWYFGLYLGLFTALYLLWLLIRRVLRPAHLAALTLAAALTLLVTGPLLAPMVRESLRYDFMRPPPGQIVELSGDLLAFFVPSILHPLWGDWAATFRAHFTASPSENTLFVGLIPLLLAAYALLRRRLRLGFWGVGALVFALFALGPVLHVAGNVVEIGGQALAMPYALLLKLPFIEIARTVARYDLLVMLCVSVLAGGGLYLLVERRKRVGLAALIGLLVLLEFAPLPYPVSPPDTPAFYETLAADPRSGAVLNLPMNWDRPGYLLYQTVHEKPLSAGYISRDDPRTYATRLPVLSDFRHNAPDINAVDVAAYAPTIFEFLDVRWVVADRYKMPEGAERELTDALVGAIFAGRAPVYEDERISVYETWPPQTRLPFIEIGFDWGDLGPEGRQVDGAATLIIHSPEARRQRLEITPAAGNNLHFWLEDAAGREIGAEGGKWSLDLLSGPNLFVLKSEQKGLMIHQLRLSK